LVPTLISCFTGAEREKLHAGRDARQTTAHQGTTPSGKRVEDAPARESETATTDTRIRWDYVALGDSLAAGAPGLRASLRGAPAERHRRPPQSHQPGAKWPDKHLPAPLVLR
jgi:hypothetical protein